MNEAICQYCQGTVDHADEDLEDNDQCCLSCALFGYDIVRMIERALEP